jgi:hypothetical protein
VSDHPLAGSFSVEASARRIRNYRYAEERMMRTLGGWIALTPELGPKLLFGRHVWDCAQHADLWGRRLPELRAPAQQSEPANGRFVAFMDLLDARETRHETVERVVGVYRVLKPHLVATYEAHLAAANPVYEPPTRRILERCLTEERRHVAAAAVVLERLLDPDAKRRAGEWQARLLDALAASGGVTGETPTPLLATEVPGIDASGDVVTAPAAFDPNVIAADLRSILEDHCRALIARDGVHLREHVADERRAAVLAVYDGLPTVRACEIAAQAKIGAHRLIKIRLVGPSGVSVLQLQWQKRAGGWHVVEAELVRVEPAA